MEPWEIVWFSTNDYAEDPVKRSVSVFLMHVMDVPVSQQSNEQRSVTLSS